MWRALWVIVAGCGSVPEESPSGEDGRREGDGCAEPTAYQSIRAGAEIQVDWSEMDGSAEGADPAPHNVLVSVRPLHLTLDEASSVACGDPWALLDGADGVTVSKSTSESPVALNVIAFREPGTYLVVVAQTDSRKDRNGAPSMEVTLVDASTDADAGTWLVAR